MHGRVTVGIISGYGVPPLLVLSLHLQVPSDLLLPTSAVISSPVPSPLPPSLPSPPPPSRRYFCSISLIALATLYTLVCIRHNASWFRPYGAGLPLASWQVHIHRGVHSSVQSGLS
ncbi:hypothetical protein CBL_04080 [Carabus blaptoides fortunei]